MIISWSAQQAGQIVVRHFQGNALVAALYQHVLHDLADLRHLAVLEFVVVFVGEDVREFLVEQTSVEEFVDYYAHRPAE